MNRIIVNIIIIIVSTISVYAQQSTVRFKREKIQEAVPIENFDNIGGFLGLRMKNNYLNYIKKFPIEEHVQFLEERKHREWDWKKAEQPGKWLESSLWASELYDDEGLKQEVMEYFYR